MCCLTIIHYDNSLARKDCELLRFFFWLVKKKFYSRGFYPGILVPKKASIYFFAIFILPINVKSGKQVLHALNKINRRPTLLCLFRYYF